MWCVKQLDASVSLMPCRFLLHLGIHTRCITCSVLPLTANSSGLEWSVQVVPTTMPQSRVVLEAGFLGKEIRFVANGPKMNHYSCTPLSVSPNAVTIGAPIEEIIPQLRMRAARYDGDLSTFQDHPYRVTNPYAAAAYFIWMVNETPIALDMVGQPCCGCGCPTKLRCRCRRAWLCEQCAGYHVFQCLTIGGPIVFPGGVCRKCLCDNQRASGLR
jgi:hypothetical protein